MNLTRTPLLIETVAPVGWTARTGVKYSGLTTLGHYPAGETGVRAHYDDTPENRKIARAQTWRFLQPVAIGKKKLKTP